MDQLNIYQKLNEVKSSIEGFTKDAESYKYKYVSGSQVLHRIKPKMLELGLILMPSTEDEVCESVQITRFNQKLKREVTSTEYVVRLKLIYTWVNADKPEEVIRVPFYAVGQQDDPAKAYGTALTYAERYFLMKFFNLPTDEDDADAMQKADRYTKVDVKQIETLKTEINKFAELMQSQGKKVDFNAVAKQLNISTFETLTNSQIANAINTLNNWSKQ